MVSLNAVRDIDITKIRGMADLLKTYVSAGGFMSYHVGKAFLILKEVLAKKDMTIFMSFPADIIATGCRGIIKDMIKLGYVDIIITTCGTWDHDIARTFKDYYIGSFYEDDKSLIDKNIHRLGNILIPRENYGDIIEKKIRPLLEDLYNAGRKKISTYELSWYFADILNESSILWWAKQKRVPIIVTTPYDGAVGSQIWFFQQFYKDFELDISADESLLSDAVFEAKETAAIIIGGGVSKHHLLWWNQFRGGLDYAIQITTAIELDGSLSGARLDEAISWGKIKKESRNVSIWGDATIILPIIIFAVYQEIGKRK